MTESLVGACLITWAVYWRTRLGPLRLLITGLLHCRAVCKCAVISVRKGAEIFAGRYRECLEEARREAWSAD